MSNSASPESDFLLPEQWRALDKRVRKVDEDRWLSSRYAPADTRNALMALYAFNYELARVRLVVSEDMLGAIRFQWWREALGELSEGKPPRKHDVVLALSEFLKTETLKIGALEKLVDGYQTAFENEDRAQEPEAWLMAVAANILAPAHGWGEAIRAVAPAYAAGRRGASKAFGPIVPKAPPPIRPAIAHVRLRRIYAKGKEPNHIAKRLSIMRGITSGDV